MAIVEYERNGFLISTNKAKLNVGMIHDYLANSSYWAQGRPIEVVRKAIQNSLCFGLYAQCQQIGFARVVTDCATFAWLCDVFIIEDYRGQGLGKWLVECVVQHPELQGLRRMMLATQDAHELYRKTAGFTSLKLPEWIMERSNPTSTSAGDAVHEATEERELS
jgi:GNAT superfamily N-acetyltransferase